MTASLLLPVRHIVRVTVEAVTPISISSGEEDTDIDAPLFRDWNGLPCLAGTALAGVLRSLHVDYYGEKATRAVFGKAAEEMSDDYASRLMISFGLVHDQNDHVVDELLLPDKIAEDTVLSLLRQPAPLHRDSVAIDQDSGAAAHGAKFDRAACPVGTRFTFEMAIDADGDDAAAELKMVTALLMSPYARVGGATRRGLGRITLKHAFYTMIDRRGANGRERWIAYRKSKIGELPQAMGLSWVKWTDLAESLAKTPSRRAPIEATLTLTPKGFWRLGQGTQPWTNGDDTPDRMPLSEPVVVWTAEADKERGSVIDRPLAAFVSAGLKGAIAHRTEFHLRRIRNHFGRGQHSGQDDAQRGPDKYRLVDELFGAIANKSDGHAGTVLIDDVILDFGQIPEGKRAAKRVRNSLDRHTGGTRDGKLFTLEAHWKAPSFNVPFIVLTRGSRGEIRVTREVARALDWAIEDVVEGRLAIGAGDGVGDGVMDGMIIWSECQATLEEALGALDRGATI